MQVIVRIVLYSHKCNINSDTIKSAMMMAMTVRIFTVGWYLILDSGYVHGVGLRVAAVVVTF
jgi:hypothetical protein